MTPAETESETEDTPIDRRIRMPDRVEEWKEVAVEEDVVLMLEAENQTVFVAWIEDDNWKDADGTWVCNDVNEAGRRQDAYCSENLIDRWFREAVGQSRLWKLGPDEAPLDVEKHQKEAA